MSITRESPERTGDAEIASRIAEVPSGTIHYHEAGTGHPVVLLHGSGPGATGLANFRPNIPALATRHRVIAPDMPGWGESSPKTFDERDHVTSLLELLDALGVPRAALVGNSMGGGTTLKFAAVHPERVSHVITMGSSAPGPYLFTAQGGPTEGLAVLRAAYRDPTPASMRALVEVMTYDRAFATDELAEERSRYATAHQVHLDNFIAGMARGQRTQATQQELADISVPALIVHGRDDRVVPCEGALKLLSLIPNSRVVILNRCGHWAQIEHAAEFNRLVLDFLANN